MGLDIRWPIGLMFTLIGLLLIGTGLATYDDTKMYHRSLDININLLWGAVLLLFGLVMVFFARAAKNKQAAEKPTSSSK
jgi:CHASE3 domain sensor protein